MKMPPDVSETSNISGIKKFAGGKSSEENSVGTEFVVKNVFGHLLKNEYALPTVSPRNFKEIEVTAAFKEVVDMFKLTYAKSMSELSATLEVSPETLESVILGVSNELFCEGINWSKIATFFVFVSELTIQCLRKNFPEYIVQEALEACLKYVEGSLEKWVLDHKGWEGIIDFSKGHKKETTKTNSSGNMQNSWAKNAFFGTVRVLGTLAHLALLGDPAHAYNN